VVVDLLAQALRVHQLQLVCPIHASLELISAQLRGEINQGAAWGGDWNACLLHAVGAGEIHAPVRPDPAQAVTSLSRHRDMDHPWPIPLPFIAEVRLADAPKLAGTLVAEHGIGAAREEGRHPPPVNRDPGPPNGIDTAPKEMESTGRESALDRFPIDAQLEQLSACDHPVLPLNKLPNRVSSSSTPHMGTKCS
jgi:hypothetical protein